MSKETLFGLLDTIELLLFLSPDNYITSSTFRERFSHTLSGTIYNRLIILRNQGFVEVLKKKPIRAGDDTNEYRLTAEGVKFRNELIARSMKVLKREIEKVVKKKVTALEQPIIEDKEEQIKNFLLEISGECEGMINDETLMELQKLLKRLLSKMF